MANDDKYPVESDRRRFVKGVVGGAALSGALTVGAVSASMATTASAGGGGPTTYMSAVREAGPAPRGMPQIPVQIDEEGYLQGLWPEPESELVEGKQVLTSETELGGVQYTTEWYQYCGLQTFQGLRPDADQDQYFRYGQEPPVGDYPWMEEIEPRDRMHIDHFEGYQDWVNDMGDSVGKPATGTWRSQDVPPEEQIPVLVIRSELIQEKAQDDEWLDAACPEGFVAFVNKCTHFCCVPGYKRSDEAPNYNAANKIYCQCHQSVYDPFTIVQDDFIALPRSGGDDEE